jgi:alkylation response protein AidB-like acyl-CoA dehydrogenase
VRRVHTGAGRTVCFAAVEFELSSDQQDLADAARDLLDGLVSRERVRAFVGSGSADDPGQRSDGFDRPLWEAMVDQGWLGVERPELAGGLGLGMVEVAVLCEQLGRRTAPAPFLGSVLALAALQGAHLDDVSPAASAQAEEWAVKLSEGEAVGCVVWAADPGTVTARPDGDDWRLAGRPEPTLYASEADVSVVVTDDAVYSLALPDDQRPPPEPAMDRTRSLAWVRLQDTPAVRIGGPESATRLVDRAAAGAAAELLGSAEHVLAIKHRLADALVDVEAMRSSVYFAAWCLASDDPDASLAASMAKAWCSDASQRVMATGMQVHGGIGFTWDHDIHLSLKRARLDASSFGSAPWHRERIAARLQQRHADGVAPI